MFQVAKNHKEAFSGSNVYSAMQQQQRPERGQRQPCQPAPRGFLLSCSPGGSAGAGGCCCHNLEHLLGHLEPTKVPREAVAAEFLECPRPG